MKIHALSNPAAEVIAERPYSSTITGNDGRIPFHAQ